MMLLVRAIIILTLPFAVLWAIIWGASLGLVSLYKDVFDAWKYPEDSWIGERLGKW